MRKILQIARNAILTTAVCLGIVTSPVYAKETLQVEIPFSIALSGDTEQMEESYKVSLSAQENTVPMPEGSVDGVCTLEVSGVGEFHFPQITYDTVGIYSYTVMQVSGTNELCTYDETVYDVTVYITNDLDGSGLESTVVVYREGETDEKTNMVFENYYETPIPPVDITVVKKWVDDGEDRPVSVTVQLLKDGEVYETVTLSAENNWSYTWKELSGEFQWSVVESNVPKGYVASYSQNNGVVTITNTESLIQTGQLIWPIVVFGVLGTLMILLGGFLLLKNRKKNNA